MAREDRAARKSEKGLCGVALRSRPGQCCQHVRNECPYHAPSDQRCQSTIDGDPESGCYNHKADGRDYCVYHAEFPHLGRNLRDFAIERLAAGRPLLYTDFMRQCYPEALAQTRGPGDIRIWRRLAAFYTGAVPETIFPDA